MVDKNQALIEYLLTCPTVALNPLFFNFGKQTDNSNQIFTKGSEVAVNRPYIDGSVLKRYTFTIYIYKSVTYNPVVKVEGFVDENVSDLAEVQAVIDWVSEQNELRNFPKFDEWCIIDTVEPLTNEPVLNRVDDSKLSSLILQMVKERNVNCSLP